MPQIVALVESAYRGESSRSGWTTEADLLDGQRTDPREVESVLDHVVVAEGDDGELLGCCTLVPREGHAYFGMFAVRPGLHCAPYVHKAIGSYPDGLVRVSPGPFNTVAEIDIAINALREVTMGI